MTTARRASALPEVPTLQEAGLPGYDLSVWMGVFVGKRVPEPVLARLQEAFGQAMDEAAQSKLRAAYTDPLLVPAAELPRWVAAEQERWGRLAREARLTVD